MLSIEQFYDAFSVSGLLDSARIRFMPSGRFTTVAGTFRDRPFNDFSSADGGGMADASPTFQCPESLVAGISQGDQVLVRNVNYAVRGVGDPNDRGEVLLKLKLP